MGSIWSLIGGQVAGVQESVGGEVTDDDYSVCEASVEGPINGPLSSFLFRSQFRDLIWIAGGGTWWPGVKLAGEVGWVERRR